MLLDDKLKKLQNIDLEKPDSVLSIYLNTNPANKTGDWKLKLKNGLNSFENYLIQSEDKQELRKFKQVRKEVEDYIFANQLQLQKGIVLFISSEESLWFVEHLQMDIKTEFHWREYPVTDQLYQLKAEFPKSGIILVQQSKVKVIEAELGAVLETWQFQLDMDEGEWHQFKEGASHEEMETGQQSFSLNQSRWYKRLAPKLDGLAAEKAWVNIYLIGDKEEINTVNTHMNKPVDKLEHRNLLNHDESKIIHTIVA